MPKASVLKAWFSKIDADVGLLARCFAEVLEELLETRVHILLVVDEYGGMDGLVTLEDLVETLIGMEIVDEADKVEDMRHRAREKWKKRMEKMGIKPIDFESPQEE